MIRADFLNLQVDLSSVYCIDLIQSEQAELKLDLMIQLGALYFYSFYDPYIIK